MLKRHSLSPLLLAGAASLALSGCLSNPAATGGGAGSSASAAPAATKLEVIGGYASDLSDYNKTIVVPTVYVKLLVEGKAFVSKQGGALQSIGGNANTVKASARYKVQGLDKAMAQAIARQAQDDFVKRMRAAGYTVLTYDDIKTRDYVQSAERAKPDTTWGLPTESPQGSSDVFLVATPSDEQQFKIGFTGVFAEFMSRGKPKFEDAVVVIPQYTIVAPQIWGETGRGFNTISAQINTAPGMNLQYAIAPWMGKPRVRMGGSKAPGVVTKGPVINISTRAGDLAKSEVTTPKAANALSKGLSMLTGAGSITAESANYTLTVEPGAYTAGAMKGIGDFNAEVARYAVAGK